MKDAASQVYIFVFVSRLLARTRKIAEARTSIFNNDKTMLRVEKVRSKRNTEKVKFKRHDDQQKKMKKIQQQGKHLNKHDNTHKIYQRYSAFRCQCGRFIPILLYTTYACNFAVAKHNPMTKHRRILSLQRIQCRTTRPHIIPSFSHTNNIINNTHAYMPT